MQLHKLSDQVALSSQIFPGEMAEIRAAGYRSIICNRPDGEGSDQPVYREIGGRCAGFGSRRRFSPSHQVVSPRMTQAKFGQLLEELPKPILAFCRTGTRSASLWALSEAKNRPLPEILERTRAAGYDMSGIVRRIANRGRTPTNVSDASHEIVIVGAGSAGVAVASSLLARKPDLDIAIIDPADVHYYQPGWTLVGAGVFDPATTVRTISSVLPARTKWIKAAVTAFEPKDDAIILEGCRVVKYKRLIVSPGLKLDWHKVDGLVETLGRNGVTSNYRYDLAPYTWELVRGLKSGRALFTQPPMPIKCAGAPQKAMYLSADHWYREGCISNIDIGFYTAGAVLFGVPPYVPALMEYVQRYGAKLNFQHNLVAIDGPSHKAWFLTKLPDGSDETVEAAFDMIHVTPPQTAPDFIRVSPLADGSGWLDVDQATMRHKSHANIYALGDVTSTPNAKTAAAARKQAPVVAENVLLDMGLRIGGNAIYDGYGSCPLTVERGKIVLAEFGYGGKLLPSFPSWMIDGTRPSRLAWWLKERILPPVYWRAMLKGREWLAHPEVSASGERAA